MMVARGEDCDPLQIPIEIPRYGTFPQGAASTLPRPHPYQQQFQLPPAPLPAYQAIPIGYQSIPYAEVAEGIPIRQRRLPCFGIGIGWLLFLSGFFLATVPWYVGTLIFLVGALGYQEKPGLVACTVAAFLAAVPISFKAFFG